MSIVRRNGDGKIRIDWGALIPMILSLLLSGVITGFGSYYAIRYDISQQEYRMTKAESRIDTIDLTVNALRMKDAADSEAYKSTCQTLTEIKQALNEIRHDQIRRKRNE